VVTPALEPDEALALDGLLSLRRPVLPGRPLRIALSRFEAALREYAIDPRGAYEAVSGAPLRDRPAERAAARQTQNGLRSWLAAHHVARKHPPVAAWLDEAARQGRVRTDTRPVVDQALRIVGALPTPKPIQRAVLAAAVLDGDPHGLDAETPVHRLTVALLAAAEALAAVDPGRGGRLRAQQAAGREEDGVERGLALREREVGKPHGLEARDGVGLVARGGEHGRVEGGETGVDGRGHEGIAVREVQVERRRSHLTRVHVLMFTLAE